MRSLLYQKGVAALVASMCVCVAWSQQGLETHTPFPAQIVLNAPYTATRVTTSFQKLASGTQISHETVTQVARDSVGRTWLQFPVENKDALLRNGKKSTGWSIWDPITYTMTNGCDCNHVAWRKHFDPPRPPRHADSAHGRAPGVNVYIGPSNDRMRYVMQKIPGEDLMGIRTEGSKATRVVPAGKDGNDHDLVWTVQSWYAPDLKLALATIVDDPIKGITKYEFRDLKRVEPNASLFAVPPGYSVKAPELPAHSQAQSSSSEVTP